MVLIVTIVLLTGWSSPELSLQLRITWAPRWRLACLPVKCSYRCSFAVFSATPVFLLAISPMPGVPVGLRGMDNELADPWRELGEWRQEFGWSKTRFMTCLAKANCPIIEEVGRCGSDGGKGQINPKIARTTDRGAIVHYGEMASDQSLWRALTEQRGWQPQIPRLTWSPNCSWKDFATQEGNHANLNAERKRKDPHRG